MRKDIKKDRSFKLWVEAHKDRLRGEYLTIKDKDKVEFMDYAWSDFEMAKIGEFFER